MHPSPQSSDLLRALWTLDVLGKKPEYFTPPQAMRDRVESLEKLPPLPEIARRFLELKSDPYCDAAKLAQIVELDPALAAQVIRWANSALFGYRRRILTVKDAIVLALGFEQVFYLAFSLCSLKPLQAPTEGLLGKRFFWRQTLAGSALMQKLVLLLDAGERPDLAAVHLVYLLHNTGHLLLAHLFRNEFDYLVRVAGANTGSPLISIERFTLGVDHGQLGAWLMQAWSMPEYLQTVIHHHHNPFYRGDHERIVWLTCLTDHLLGRIGIGDACHLSLADTPLYRNLKIDPATAEECLQRIVDAREELDRAVTCLI
jgi:HD-like signal output (HDOD) protein